MAGILTVFGTRPEAIKLAPVIDALGQRSAPVRICVTGQHRALLDQVLSATGIVPDIDLALMTASQSLNGLTAAMLTRLDAVFETEKPDRVVVQGDTSTALAAAMAAHHRRIPVAHVEAGLRSGDNRNPWPEEFNRRAISAIADLHFAPTRRAADALAAEGYARASIHVTGNTAIDALRAMRARLALEPALAAPVASLIEQIADRRLILITCHRRENIGEGIAEITAAIRALSAREDVAVVVPIHPNPLISGPLRAALRDLFNVFLVPALDYPCFIQLLSAAHIVLTDSGGVQEEAPSLGKPVLVLRETTERPEAIDAGTVRLVGARAGRIVPETCLLLDNAEAYARMAHAHSPYGDGYAADRIADILTEPAAARAAAF